ncbi:peptidoglycan-binding protein [Paenibacillus chartarius]|uniref:Peptidoglycan-binding protein n=1 Tax=Paenibacillus chartarius TaxID=747481 RepID=A0ABV6DH30_9BACL
MEQTPARLMARRGKSHLEIIKHFYGSHFETTFAAQIVIHNELYSFIPPLSLGDTDKQVVNIQHYLDVIGKKYDQAAFSAAVDENGRFGEKTKEAVTLFQKHFMKLTPDNINGVLDLKTWYALLTRYLKAVNNGNQRNAASARYFMPIPQYGLVCRSFLTPYGPQQFCYYTYSWEMIACRSPG